MTEKPHIDFDLIEMIIVERIQRRVFASKIIHPDLVSGFLKLPDRRDHTAAVADDNPLREFEADDTVRHFVLTDNFIDCAKRVAAFKITPGQVDRNRNQRKAVVHPVSQDSKHPSQNELVKPVDERSLLQNRHKDSR